MKRTPKFSNSGFHFNYGAGRPDEFVKKIDHNIAQTIFVKIMYCKNVTTKKVARKYALLLPIIFKKLPNVNHYSMGENSHNLVTLLQGL
jgi:hypothetical protein